MLKDYNEVVRSGCLIHLHVTNSMISSSLEDFSNSVAFCSERGYQLTSYSLGIIDSLAVYSLENN